MCVCVFVRSFVDFPDQHHDDVQFYTHDMMKSVSLISDRNADLCVCVCVCVCVCLCVCVCEMVGGGDLLFRIMSGLIS